MGGPVNDPSTNLVRRREEGDKGRESHHASMSKLCVVVIDGKSGSPSMETGWCFCARLSQTNSPAISS